MLPPQTFDEAFDRVKGLVSTFGENERDFLSPSYSETDVRKDFIDKFWIALGWDVNHDLQKNPYERQVKVENNVNVEGRRKKADYAFLAPNFRDVLFFVEAKKPARNIDNPDDYFQTVRYGWNAGTPLSILTDFEQFRLLDCRYKPDVHAALQRAVRKFHFTEYADEEKFREIYHIFSHGAVADGALEKFASALPKAPGKAVQRKLFGGAYKSVDEDFLQELDALREELARSFKHRNLDMNGEELTEATQRTLDRLVFMRFLEDKLIEPEAIVERLGERGTAWGDFLAESSRLDRIYNGIIFKRHPIIDDPSFVVDDRVFVGVRERLAHTNTPYDFNSLPVHILGSIYERFLGKVIVTTDKRARVEEKQEVRKAGGVYYTPEYIVRHIVEQVVGQLIAGKTPEEIALMRFADISCGSGSFLLGVYDELLRYHTAFYNEPGNRRKALKAGCVVNADDSLRLSLNQRKDILLNNIYGVDLDPQAVEVAQLSLFLKLLEEETTASAKGYQLQFRETMLPSLDKNIVHGNALIGWDVLDGELFDDEQRKLNPLDFVDKFNLVMKGGGFDAILGNPPYIRIQTLQETTPLAVEYFKSHYVSAGKGNYDIYVAFVERALSLLKEGGKFGYILPHKFFNAKYGEPLRGLLSQGKHLAQIVHFGDQQVFAGASTYTCLLFLSERPTENCDVSIVKNLDEWRRSGSADKGAIPAAKITTGEWNFSLGDKALLLNKLSQMPTKLEHVTSRIFQGLKTSADKVFIVEELEREPHRVKVYSKENESEYWLEPELLHPLIKGGDSKRYALARTRRLILFPYERQQDGRVRLIPAPDFKSCYPLTWSYLIENKKFLENRENGKMRGAHWYAYGRNQALDVMPLPKIFTPDIAPHSAYSLDVTGEMFFTGGVSGGYGILASADMPREYLLGLLNSKLLEWFVHQTATQMRGGWFSYEARFIRGLPIRTISDSEKEDAARRDKVIALVEQMLSGKGQLQQARTDRDRNFYENKCAMLDRQIDALVYELYGLSAEEIKIVEGDG
jgi:type I restriction-modification system DNA methylase subunit